MRPWYGCRESTRRATLKWSPDPDYPGPATQDGRVADRLRSSGYPYPVPKLPGSGWLESVGRAWTWQTALPGNALARRAPTPAIVAQALTLNLLQVGRADVANPDWTATLTAWTLSGGPGPVVVNASAPGYVGVASAVMRARRHSGIAVVHRGWLTDQST